jgi:hypothetical protein
VELGIGDGQKGDDGDGIQPIMELPGGQKLLSGRVAEIEEKSLPLFGIKTAKDFCERRGTTNFK